MDHVFKLTAFGSRTALINERGEYIDYCELVSLYGEMSRIICAKDKRLVFILAQNNIETITGYLAVIQSNNVALLIDPKLDKEFLQNLIREYKPDYVWGPNNDNELREFVYRSYSLVKYDWPGVLMIDSDLSVLLSTSGSTGSPKLVRLSKSNLVNNAEAIAAYLNLDEKERPITNLPLHYSYGLSVINSHLFVGATILLTEISIVKKEFWEYFKLEEATSLCGVPYTYEILNSIGFSNMKLPSLRYMTQAGGKLDSQKMIDYAKLSLEKHFDFYVMYGATEATARMSYLSPEFNITKTGSIGKPIPSGSFRLEGENDIITTPYKEGEIVYQGLNVMMGYANCREDLVKKDELQGVLRTGDIGYFDEAGFYYITGRKSRFLKVLGKRIGLHEVEKHLARIGCRCFCGGEDDRLFIAVQLEEVEKFYEATHKIKKEVIARFKIPADLIHILQLADIPRSSCGKIKYKEIYQHYINQ